MVTKAEPKPLKRVVTVTVNEQLTEKQLAARWSTSPRTLQRLRELEDDPLPCKRFGRKVLYVAKDVNEWLERQS